MVSAIFEEIYNDPERFPISIDTGGYGWRYAGKKEEDTNYLSEHAHGIAIDISSLNNPQFWSDGSHTEGAYEPHKNPYSITPESSVVRIFKKYGWQWGGDAWLTTQDYMHFQWTFA